jgi:hypothetical protein
MRRVVGQVTASYFTTAHDIKTGVQLNHGSLSPLGFSTSNMRAVRNGIPDSVNTSHADLLRPEGSRWPVHQTDGVRQKAHDEPWPAQRDQLRLDDGRVRRNAVCGREVLPAAPGVSGLDGDNPASRPSTI